MSGSLGGRFGDLTLSGGAKTTLQVYLWTTMGAAVLPILVMTLFWGVVGIVLPFIIPKGPNQGLLQTVLVLTGFTCYLFWLAAYMAQMNPLFGPQLHNTTMWVMRKEWGMADISE